MEEIVGKWEMKRPKGEAISEILDFKYGNKYYHRLINSQNNSIESFYGTYEVIPHPNDLTELLLVPAEEQEMFELQSHLYLHTSYLIKQEANLLIFHDNPGKREEYVFQKV